MAKRTTYVIGVPVEGRPVPAWYLGKGTLIGILDIARHYGTREEAQRERNDLAERIGVEPRMLRVCTHWEALKVMAGTVAPTRAPFAKVPSAHRQRKDQQPTDAPRAGGASGQ